MTFSNSWYKKEYLLGLGGLGGGAGGILVAGGPILATSDDGYQIKKSLRFNRGDSAWLKRVDKTGNRRQWTWSGWVKKTDITNSQTLFSGTVGTGSQIAGSLEIRIVSGTQLYIAFCESNGTPLQWSAEGKAYYRDPSAWQHWVVVLDTTNPEATERCKVYVNGKKVEDWGTRNTITQNFEYGINKDGAYHLIGVHYSGENLQEHFDGYFSNVEFIDGLCLSPAAFGSFDSTGNWNPKAFALPTPNTTAGSPTWSSNTSGGSVHGSYPMTQSFDGKITTAGVRAVSGGGFVWQPTDGLAYTTSIEVHSGASGVGTQQCKINDGTAVNVAENTWVTVKTGSGTLTKLEMTAGSTGNANIYLGGVRIDGVILVDGQTDVATRNNRNNGTTWSGGVTGNPVDATLGFDGSLGTRLLPAGGDNCTWKPSSTITADKQIRLYCLTRTDAVNFKVNGTNIKSDILAALGDNTHGWFDLNSLSTPITTINTTDGIYLDKASGSAATNNALYAIEVDGHVLIDAAVDNSFHLKFNDTVSNVSLGRDSIKKLSDETIALPIYNTDDSGAVKGSGYRTDSNSAYLELAVPGDSVATGTCDVHQQINTGSSNRTATVSGSVVKTGVGGNYNAALFFDGTDDKITFANTADLCDMGTGNFTWECWVKPTDGSNGGNAVLMGTRNATGSGTGSYLYMTDSSANSNVRFHWRNSSNGSADMELGNNVGCPKDQWSHIAVVRNSTKLTLYLNGLDHASTSGGTNPATVSTDAAKSDDGVFTIGASGVSGNFYNGHMQDVRVYKGVAKYTANFIPPIRNDFIVNNLTATAGRTVDDADDATKPFYVTTGDQGGTKGSGYNTDSSAGTTDGTGLVFALPGDVLTDEHDHVNTGSSAKTVETANSMATTTSDSRFYGTSLDFGAYNVAKKLYVTAANAGSDFNFGTGDFTVECWFKQTDQTLNSGSPQTIFDFDADATNSYGGGWLWLATNASNLVIYWSDSASSLAYDTVMAKDSLLNTWTHFAACHDTSANKLYTFINGELKNSINYSTNWTGDRGVYLGWMNLSGDQNRTFAGLINDFRVYKGVAKYTSAFNPPAIGDPGDIDSFVDTPTNYEPEDGDTGLGGEVRGNYCTMSPISQRKSGSNLITLSQGNLKCENNASAYGAVYGTMAVKGSGKWYFECTIGGSVSAHIGSIGLTPSSSTSLDTNPETATGGYGYGDAGAHWDNGVTDNSTGWDAWVVDDVLGVKLDLDSGTKTIQFLRNNTSQGTLTINDATLDFLPFWRDNTNDSTTAATGEFNFGQRAFKYSQTGYKSWCTQNLPDTFGDDDDTNNPSKYFDDVLWSGNDTAGTDIQGFNFGPDFVWIKQRNGTNWHKAFDQIRGVGKPLHQNETNAEATEATTLTAFNSDGFELGTSGTVNAADYNYVGWGWDAGTAAVTPSSSYNITPTDQWINTTAGFSITGYTGNGSDDQTLPHGLNAVPGLVIIKNRDSSSGSWIVKHSSLSSGKVLFLDNDNAEGDSSYGEIKDLDSNVTVTLDDTGNNAPNVNKNTEKYIMYAWTAIPGYSAFGSYNGNVFTYLGFKPKTLIIKDVNDASVWQMYTTAVNVKNPMNHGFTPSQSVAEQTNYEGGDNIDWLSNGFRVQGSGGGLADTKMLYVAFAEHPLKTARAR